METNMDFVFLSTCNVVIVGKGKSIGWGHAIYITHVYPFRIAYTATTNAYVDTSLRALLFTTGLAAILMAVISQ